MTHVPQDSVWYEKDVMSRVTPEGQRLLEVYANVPTAQVEERVKKARDKAASIENWVSTHLLAWVHPYILSHPAHERILSAVKNGASIVDCGCMFATDLRQLALEGSPTDNMYGFDIEPRFFDVAYDYFGDRDGFKATFVPADMHDQSSASVLKRWQGRFDIVWASKVIHTQDYENQIVTIARLIKLLKPQKGSMFCGSQSGYPGGRHHPTVQTAVKPGVKLQESIYLGDPEGYAELWRKVEAVTGTEWDFEADLFDMNARGVMKLDMGDERQKFAAYNLVWTAVLREPGPLMEEN